MLLLAGENVISLSYGCFSSNIVLNVSAAAQPTEPSVPETQPTEPSPAPTGNIRVTNVALSSDLTQYTLNLCSQYGVDSSVIFSVMYHESQFNAGATSGCGAE